MTIAADTEVLTDSGFILAKDIKPLHKVATVNLKTQKILFLEPLSIKPEEIDHVELAGLVTYELVSSTHRIRYKGSPQPISKLIGQDVTASDLCLSIESRPAGIDRTYPSLLRLVPYISYFADLSFGQLPRWGSATFRRGVKSKDLPHFDLLHWHLQDADIGYEQLDDMIKVVGKDFERLMLMHDRSAGIPPSLVNASRAQMNHVLSSLRELFGPLVDLDDQDQMNLDVLQIAFFRNGWITQIDPLSAAGGGRLRVFEPKDAPQEVRIRKLDTRGTGIRLKTEYNTLVTRRLGRIQVTGGQ